MYIDLCSKIFCLCNKDIVYTAVDKGVKKILTFQLL
jgi:hypothetical protein